MKLEEFLKINNLTEEEFEEMVLENDFYKITELTDANGIKIAYASHMDYEMGFIEEDTNGNSNASSCMFCTYKFFKEEFKKGYNNSDCNQIARLFLIEDNDSEYKGIYYDNTWVR